MDAARLFDARSRGQLLDEVDGQSFDLVIVGGGINGAGIAHDAALRGLKVLVIEQRDLAFGTSSRSSKLIHGGLRYLEHYQFKLVFEGTNERAALRKVALGSALEASNRCHDDPHRGTVSRLCVRRGGVSSPGVSPPDRPTSSRCCRRRGPRAGRRGR